MNPSFRRERLAEEGSSVVLLLEGDQRKFFKDAIGESRLDGEEEFAGDDSDAFCSSGEYVAGAS